MTLVRDRRGLLPCNDKKSIAVIGITEYSDEMELLEVFKDELSQDGARVDLYRQRCENDKIPEYDLVVYCTFGHQNKPCGAIQVIPNWQTATLNKDSTIVVAFGSPYLIKSNFPTVNTAIAVYSDTEYCMRSAAKGILGKIPFRGKLPVKLQELY